MEAEITLRDMLNRAHNNTAFDVQLRMQSADTHEEILKQLERALALAVGLLVRNRKYKQGQSEDALTTELVSLLNMNGIPACHDAKIGGHTDISVEMKDGFLWIGEAKHWTGKSWIFKGFRQLMTRYATGLPGQDQGAVIIYFDQERPSELMGKWRNSLAKITATAGKVEEIDELNFKSSHLHKGTGRTFHVKHLGIPLYWNPEDG